jgi:UDP-2,3-diacylglucosamine hydrolase
VRRVGILAGWGEYPIVVADMLRRQGCQTYCLGVIGHANPELQKRCDVFQWIGLAKLGGAIRFFRRHGVTQATMAGKVHKVVLFRSWRWIRHLPDWQALRTFLPHFLTRRKDCRDDSLLGTIVNAFAAEGIHFGPATDYAPELLVKPGQLSQLAPAGWQ